MKIIRTTSGNVIVKNAAGKTIYKINPQADLEVKNDNEVLVKNVQGQYYTFFADRVTHTQIEPAAQVAFSGDAYALIDLLQASFFFKLSGGGDAIDINYDNAVSGLTATNVQDAIDEIASGGGAGIGFYPSGQWNTLYKGTTFSLWAGASLNTLSYLSITVLSEITIDKIRFLTNSSAVGQLAIGLYDITLNKVTDVAFNTALPAGTQTLNLSAPVTLPPGTYFWLFSSTAAIQIGIISEDNLQLLGHDTTNGAVGRRFLTPYVHTFPMPDPAPAPTSFDNLDFRFLIQAYIV